MSANACEEMIAIAYQGSDVGAMTISVNDVILLQDHKGSSFNFMPPTLLLNGDNSINVTLKSEDTSAKVSAEVYVGCEGQMPNAPGENGNVLTRVDVKGSGNQSSTFQSSGLPAYAYLSASPTNDEGLIEAISAMRAAARNNDVDAYVSYFQPMLDDFAIEGEDMSSMVVGMSTHLLSPAFNTTKPGNLIIKPVIDGRAYQVTDDVGQGPLQFKATESSDGMPSAIAQASIWIKTMNGWKVLRQ